MAYRVWARRKFEGFPPDPTELMTADLDYYNEVLLYADIVEYVRSEQHNEF
jgi:hypothetical protein